MAVFRQRIGQGRTTYVIVTKVTEGEEGKTIKLSPSQRHNVVSKVAQSALCTQILEIFQSNVTSRFVGLIASLSIPYPSMSPSIGTADNGVDSTIGSEPS